MERLQLSAPWQALLLVICWVVQPVPLLAPRSVQPLGMALVWRSIQRPVRPVKARKVLVPRPVVKAAAMAVPREGERAAVRPPEVPAEASPNISHSDV